jgi:hypothetical protein
MEADNFAHRCRELKRRTFLCPIWPECAPVADQSEGSQTVPAFAIAYAPFYVDEVLILLQTDLGDAKDRTSDSVNLIATKQFILHKFAVQVS